MSALLRDVRPEAPSEATGLVAAYRLTIGHLLLWMATTGAALAFVETYLPFPAPRLSGSATLERSLRHRWVINRACAPVYGLALAGGVLATCNAAKRKTTFRLQPGHWLLVLLGLWTVGMGICLTVGRASGGRDSVEFTAVAIWFAALTIATLYVACQPREQAVSHGFWQSAFTLTSVATAGLAFSAVVIAFTDRQAALIVIGLSVIPAAACAAVGALLAIVIDIVACEPRDLLHWVGVATFGLIAAHPVLLLIAR